MNTLDRLPNETEATMLDMGAKARAAARDLAVATTQSKNAAILGAAKCLRASQLKIIAANVLDIAAAKEAGRPASFVDRLMLDEKRIEAIAQSLEDIAALPDPVGTVLADWSRPNGLYFQRVRVPLGVIGIIFESRPNVTADTGALCLKAGNAAILRGGSESHRSSLAIFECLREGVRAAGLPDAAIQYVANSDRAAVGHMLSGLNGTIDVIVPRGGKSLVKRVQDEARVPVFAHLEGICHTYIDEAADLAIAVPIVVNAKMRRTGVCGATECVLVDRAAKASVLPAIIAALIEAGCEVRGDELAQKADPRVKPAMAEDWGREFLDAIVAVKCVDGVEGAIEHIARYGSQHTDAIITQDAKTAETFLARVDSAIVLVNASTQFDSKRGR